MLLNIHGFPIFNIFYKGQILSHDGNPLDIIGENVGPMLNLFNAISGFMFVEDRFLCHFERSNNNQIVHL